MSGETEDHVSGWTVDTIKSLTSQLRESDMRLMAERELRYQEGKAAEEKFQLERDRRYLEVNIEKEKALKIKETADLAALGLAREIQDYKDEKANKLREQIEGERGDYASKTDLLAAIDKLEAIVTPVVKYVDSQQGRSSGSATIYAFIFSIIFAVTAIGSLIAVFATR